MAAARARANLAASKMGTKRNHDQWVGLWFLGQLGEVDAAILKAVAAIEYP
jgi:hypothetical protein